MALHAVVVAVCFTSLALLGVGTLASLKILARPFSSLKKSDAVVLALLLAGHVFFVKPLLPHNIWHEQHAVGLLTIVEGSNMLEDLHGPSYRGAMTALHAVSGGKLSVFSLNYAVSCVSALLLFLLVFLLTGGSLPAQFAFAMLLFLPVHMRLSTTESVFVLAEFFSLLTLTLFLIAARTRRLPVFFLGLLSLVTVMHIRAELAPLFPLVLLVYLLGMRHRLPPGLYGKRGLWAGAAAVMVLGIPRALELLGRGDSRVTGGMPPQELLLTWLDRLPHLNIFFDPGYTPAVYIALFLVGLAYLCKENRRLFWCVNMHWLLLSVFYLAHLSCLALRVRTAMTTQFVFIGTAAFGLHSLLQRLRQRERKIASIAALALVCALPALHRKFLRTLYTKQQEYLFLVQAARLLPDSSLFVHLSPTDQPGIRQNLEYQMRLIVHEAGKHGKTITPMGIKAFLDLPPDGEAGDAFFYRGVSCYSIPRLTPEPPHGGSADYVHPLCARMEERFELAPVRSIEVARIPHTEFTMEGEKRAVSLSRIVRRRKS
ncbi:MAG: hypothetical protein ABIJ96_06585 [Elusimicrobiota bacterium]